MGARELCPLDSRGKAGFPPRPSVLWFLLLLLLLVPSFAFSHSHDFNVSILFSPGLYSESPEPVKAGRESSFSSIN